jgi:hypothetical protein
MFYDTYADAADTYKPADGLAGQVLGRRTDGQGRVSNTQIPRHRPDNSGINVVLDPHRDLPQLVIDPHLQGGTAVLSLKGLSGRQLLEAYQAGERLVQTRRPDLNPIEAKRTATSIALSQLAGVAADPLTQKVAEVAPGPRASVAAAPVSPPPSRYATYGEFGPGYAEPRPAPAPVPAVPPQSRASNGPRTLLGAFAGAKPAASPTGTGTADTAATAPPVPTEPIQVRFDFPVLGSFSGYFDYLAVDENCLCLGYDNRRKHTGWFPTNPKDDPDFRIAAELPDGTLAYLVVPNITFKMAHLQIAVLLVEELRRPGEEV